MITNAQSWQNRGVSHVALNKSKSKGKDTTALVTVPESDLSKDAQSTYVLCSLAGHVQTNDKVQSEQIGRRRSAELIANAAATECAEALAGHEEFNAIHA